MNIQWEYNLVEKPFCEQLKLIAAMSETLQIGELVFMRRCWPCGARAVQYV